MYKRQPSYLLTSSLSLVVAQRLARKICEHCKEEDTENTKEHLLALGFTEAELQSNKIYKGKGCNHCQETGVKGRRAIHEVLVVTNNLKEAILKDATDLEIKQIAQEKDGFKTMQDRGRQLILEGIITVEEYQRVLVVED